MYQSRITITRPANQTPYTAGDVVGGAFLLDGLPSLTDLLLMYTDLAPALSAIPSGMSSFGLYLYNVKPPSNLADNAPFVISAADAAVRAGYIALGSPALVAGSAVLFCQSTQINQPARTGANGLWAYLVTTGGYTPAANSEAYSLTVEALDITTNQ